LKWKKLGFIFSASGQNELMIKGGRCPTPLYIKDDIYRIFFGSFDDQNRSRVFSLEIDLKYPQRILNLKTKPILDLGKHGFHDDNGMIPCSLVKNEDKLFLYVDGFSIKNKVIFDAASGLAVSEDNGETFRKYDGPIIDRTIYDPCWAASSFVLYDEGIFKMWYTSCFKWEKEANGNYKHYYNIKYRESADGIHWEKTAITCIDFQNEFEYAIAKPTVIKDGPNDYKMWYSYRAQKNVAAYRIGYAESTDGKGWERLDSKIGIDVSDEGWDSEQISYNFVFDHKDNRYMLYNGNAYGKTGFGLAVLEEE
jgi:predicted GH43/DUF377 family glycosyl hydrolase